MEDEVTKIDMIDESDDSFFLDKVDTYMNDLAKLAFTDAEYESFIATGLMDKESCKIMIEEINTKINEYVTTPEGNTLEVEKDRREFIINILKIKDSIIGFHSATKDLNIPEMIAEIFPVAYPKYATMKTSFLLEEFYTYLQGRIADSSGLIYTEVLNAKKLKELAENAVDRVFDKIEKFKIQHFTSLIFEKNTKVFKELLEIPENGTLDYKKVEPMLVIFVTFFSRFIYKKYPIDNSDFISKKLFITFLKEVNEIYLDPELEALFKPLFKDIFISIRNVIIKAIDIQHTNN